MTEYRFNLRKMVGALLTTVTLLTLVASAQPTTVVYPTGIWPDDVVNVQAALNLGGTVLLKAVNFVGQPTAFNFGTPELLPGRRVLVTTDVNILGEQVGANMTTISGGLEPIRGVVPIKSRIQGIDFESPMGDAISITQSTGTEIVGNRINAVVPLPFPTFTFGDGIDVSDSNDPAHDITGTVKVSDNIITNLTADCCAAIQFDSVAAKSEITGNTITNFLSIGLLALRSGQTSVLIANNTVTVSSAIPISAGIFIDGNQTASFLVTDNVVVCDNPTADGMIVGGVFSNGTVNAVAQRNHITMHNSFFGGLSIYGQVSGALLNANTIDGDSAFALQIAEGLDPSQLAVSNRLQGNNISHAASTVADVFLGTNTQNNEVLGHCGSVIDEGVGNFVTCGKFSIGQGQKKTATLESLRAILRHPPAPPNF